MSRAAHMFQDALIVLYNNVIILNGEFSLSFPLSPDADPIDNVHDLPSPS